MKTIGLLGGMSWQSSAEYYRIINEEMNKQLGKNHSARILMYSFDFQEIELMQIHDQWDELNQLVVNAAVTLQNANAEILIICSNTMHRCFDKIQEQVKLPMIHIVESVGIKLALSEIKIAGLLGTKYLLKSNLYQDVLLNQFNITVKLPTVDQIEMINNIIYDELVKGIINPESKNLILDIIEELVNRGIESIILGCTEIPLIIKPNDCRIPVTDTTYIHSISTVKAALDI